MYKITRRQVAGTVALAGAAALAGLNPARAADEKPAPLDAKAERQRVIACGMTDAEADCWVAVA
jgi:hypothetical protein